MQDNVSVHPLADRPPPHAVSANTRLLVFATSAVLLGLTWIYADATFASIAEAEQIVDRRAGQVSGIFACWVGAIALLGGGLVLFRPIAQGAVPPGNILKSIGASRPLRLFVSGVSGLIVGTLAIGTLLLGIAQLPSVVVTPPAAWLIMTLGGALLGVALMQIFGHPREPNHV